MKSRRALTIAALAVVGVLLSGCISEPKPVETNTPFATEEEAFAAAEETYRAYVDALNDVDLSNPKTFEAVYAWTTGELNASDRTGLSKYHADGYSVSGASIVQKLELESVDLSAGDVHLAVCLDVSGVDVHDSQGTSVVDPERVDVQTLTVEGHFDAMSETGIRLALIGPRDEGPECA